MYCGRGLGGTGEAFDAVGASHTGRRLPRVAARRAMLSLQINRTQSAPLIGVVSTVFKERRAASLLRWITFGAPSWRQLSRRRGLGLPEGNGVAGSSTGGVHRQRVLSRAGAVIAEHAVALPPYHLRWVWPRTEALVEEVLFGSGPVRA
jgi:hypothetical protein